MIADRLATLSCAVLLAATAAPTAPITWDDVRPFHARLADRGITRESLPSHMDRIRQANARRVREGELDHLVFYMLQSRRFTRLPPIEPAVSARALVEALPASARDAFLRTGDAAALSVPADVRARAAALVRAVDGADADPRLAVFRTLVNATSPHRAGREEAIVREYTRTARFLYQKEFLARRAPDPAAAVAAAYRSRGLSTDTAIEAGFLVHQGLGTLAGLQPDRSVRRVLIVGPGLDLAPRTGLLEDGPPESYQPWAVIDALLALGLARAEEIEVVAADINPRVVRHIERWREQSPVLTLAAGIRDTGAIRRSSAYQEYFAGLGRAIGDVTAADADCRTIRVRPDIARRIRAVRLDITVERVPDTFDVIVATNIFPYLDDVELMLALANVAAMLAPGGAFLHNEARPAMHQLTAAIALPLAHSRHAIVASVQGAPPLGDSVWLHRKAARASP